MAPDPTYQLSAIVPYAWFLFTQRRFEEARDLYRKGLAGVKLNDNFTRYQKGRVYMFWGQNERDFAKASLVSQQAFEGSAAEFSGIDIEAFRESAQKELNAAKQAPAALANSTISKNRQPE